MAEMYDLNPELRPLLGLATTRELLEELRARSEVDLIVGKLHGIDMAGWARQFLRSLPAEVLDYRTVDHG